MSGVMAGCQSRAVERVEQFPCTLRNATVLQNTASQLHHNIHCKTEGYICCICFGIFTPLAPPLPPNRSGKRVTEACSTATLPSQPLLGPLKAQQGLGVRLGWLCGAAGTPSLFTRQFQAEPCRGSRRVAPIIERIDLGCARNLMLVRLLLITAPSNSVFI